jgi:hypothetical protein
MGRKIAGVTHLQDFLIPEIQGLDLDHCPLKSLDYQPFPPIPISK